MKRDEQEPATEQGHDRNNNSGQKVATPARIRCKAKINQTSHVAYAQQWPEQKPRGNQKGAMKECFEIVFSQEGKYAVRRKRLSGPKKNWREERSGDKRRNKVCR